MPSAARRTGSRRWTGATLVLTLGAVGALAGWTVATTMLPPASSPYFDWVVSFAMLAAMVAGPMVGVFAGLLLLGRMRREVACPRCGTSNSRSAGSCLACELPFMPRKARQVG